MIDKKIINSGRNDRLKEIDDLIDKLIPNDYINQLINKYREELKHYTYIDSVGMFSTLKLKGSMKYINKYDKKLRYGGLLIKIYQKLDKWYGIIKKSDNTKYYISFNSNYIFYCENIGEIHNLEFRDSLKFFITDVEDSKYNVV
jgi:cyclopropane fatty-acyl-phospholipid synthase-like methyltransferase